MNGTNSEKQVTLNPSSGKYCVQTFNTEVSSPDRGLGYLWEIQKAYDSLIEDIETLEAEVFGSDGEVAS